MAPQSFTDSRIGPQLDLDNIRLPPHVGDHLATLFDEDDPITSGSEWVTAMRAAFDDLEDGTPTEENLCHADDGAHSVYVDGESHSFVCVLDPLIVPFLREEPGTVESTTPLDRERVAIDIDADGASAEPEDAVVSLGISRHVTTDDQPSPELVYRQVCGYIHVFATPGEYERWAETVDAATTTVPVETGVALSRELAVDLFEA